MAVDKRHSFSISVTKLCILFLVLPQPNLVICDDLEDDSLQHALEAVERRQRDLELQDNEYYGQPETIGYGFQKSLGFFDNTGPATELGSFDSNPKNDNNLQNLFLGFGNYLRDGDFGDFDNLKSNFRERMSKNDYLINEKDVLGEEYGLSDSEYVQLLKNLWAKYQRERGGDTGVEDMTNEEVQEILGELRDDDDPLVGGDYSAPDVNSFEVVPVRKRKNYRVFEGFGDRKKRYPSFGQGIYGKRNPYSQNLNYDIPPENQFLYSLKYVNPELNREAVENLRGEGYDVLGEEKDRDVMRILDNPMNRARYEGDAQAAYWPREDSEEEVWMPGPISFSNDGYEALDRGEKRSDFTPRFFKPHNGIHLNTKRFPVKRSAIPEVKKEDKKSEKVPKEVKKIFATTESSSPVPPKKGSLKKPTEVLKKQNATKPEVTKHPETKKVVRRSGKYAGEQFVPSQGNEEIANIFSGNRKAISKKAIDWSQYFGIDKRSPQTWLKDDNIQRAEKHFMTPKSKRFPNERANLGNVNYLDRSQYVVPFDTKGLNKKYTYDIGANIEKVENKIGDIEEKLIDDAVKYTGAHSGGDNEDLNKVKNKVIQHLEAAYSLEKMKNALEEFKSLIKPVRNLAVEEIVKKASTEAPKTASAGSMDNSNRERSGAEKKPATETTKRVAIKKESAKDFLNRDSADSLEFLRDVPYPNNQYDNEACPLLDKILHNCLRVEEMGGRYAELLVPLCALQQICYYCGVELGVSKISTCDGLYLQEAQNVCQGRNECLINARDSMLAIQDLYELEVMKDNGRPNTYGSCLANSCIQRYFFNSPGAIYPLEIQK